MEVKYIRNVAVVAHIDHGKTTFSNALINHVYGGSLKRNFFKLDSMELEKERGITIKAHPVSLLYKYEGRDYLINIIDTPGHVDFSNEVLRGLIAAEGAILLIDVSKGVQPQTLYNSKLAVKNNLKLIPVLNKNDLTPCKDIKGGYDSLGTGIKYTEVLKVSSKKNEGLIDILKSIIHDIPSPISNYRDLKFRALIFDSIFEERVGLTFYVKVYSGVLKKNDKITLINSKLVFIVQSIGFFNLTNVEEVLSEGHIGFITIRVKKNVWDWSLGNTLINIKDKLTIKKNLRVYQIPQSLVFYNIYPWDQSDFLKLEGGLKQLSLNDLSLNFEKVESPTFGYGFKCGFLGFLHSDIIKNRLEREYNLSIVYSNPSITYKVYRRGGEEPFFVTNPSKVLTKDMSKLIIQEPLVLLKLTSLNQYLNSLIKLLHERRCSGYTVLNEGGGLIIEAEVPLNEILDEFNNKIQSITKGNIQLSYSFLKYKASDLVKLEFRLNGSLISDLSVLTHARNAYKLSERVCVVLKLNTKRQLFKTVIQGLNNGKIITRETINPFKKDVISKCYGGDISRKKKLLSKQKKGKAALIKKNYNKDSVTLSKNLYKKIFN